MYSVWYLTVLLSNYSCIICKKNSSTGHHKERQGKWFGLIFLPTQFFVYTVNTHRDETHFYEHKAGRYQSAMRSQTMVCGICQKNGTHIAYRRKADSALNSADQGMNDQDFTRIYNGLVHAMHLSASSVSFASNNIKGYFNFATSLKITFLKL